MARTLLILLLLGLAIYVVAMNWMCVYASHRNRRRGIDKHYSMVPLIAQILVLMAWGLHIPGNPAWLPAFSFPVIAFADISVWSILTLPFYLLYRAYNSSRSRGS